MYFFVLAVIYNGQHLLTTNLVGNQCYSYSVGGTITKVFSWATFIINGIIPFLLLIHMNYVIVQTIRNSRKMFTSNTTASTVAVFQMLTKVWTPEREQ